MGRQQPKEATGGHLRHRLGTVFGFPFSQEEVFGSFVIDLGTEGWYEPWAPNYDASAVVDDGNCESAGCLDVGDNAVTVGDLLEILRWLHQGARRTSQATV